MSVLAVHDAVEAEIAELMGVLNTTTARLVAVIAHVDRTALWQTCAGIRSLQHWVTWQCGVSPGRARQLVAIARRGDDLPASNALFEQGHLTEDTMGAIARRVPAARDEEVAELAPLLLYNQLQRVLHGLPLPEPEPPRDFDPPPTEPDPPKREVDFGSDGDQWWARIALPLDEGKLVEQALRVARTAVFHERHPDLDDHDAYVGRSGVSWADGLLRMAECTVVGLPGLAARRPADRQQVWLHYDVAEGHLRHHLEGPMPDSIRRYLLCDADVRAVLESDGVLHAMSSRLRTVDDRMRAFVEQRDGGCAVPGCTQRLWLQIHHITHWEDGGATESPNLCALCPLHHRLHHSGALAIEGDPSTPGGLEFRDRHGIVISAKSPEVPAEPPDPPPKPYVHPTGERLDLHWITWRDNN